MKSRKQYKYDNIAYAVKGSNGEIWWSTVSVCKRVCIDRFLTSLPHKWTFYWSRGFKVVHIGEVK